MTITFEELEAEVRKLANEQPNFIYWPNRGLNDLCMYNADIRQPGCIFGQAFARLKVGIDSDSGSIGRQLERLDIPHTTEQKRWALIVQRRQDGYNTWRYSVIQADTEMALSREAEERYQLIREEMDE